MLQYYWSLTIRLFSVLSGHTLEESYPSAEMQSMYSTAPAGYASKFLIFDRNLQINIK